MRADYYVDGEPETIVAEVRFNDECHNGHKTFAITGTIYNRSGCGKGLTHEDGSYLRPDSMGCIHGEIAKHLPHLAKYLKWHLCSTDGPLHYIANTLYLADDKDCWGLRKGEFNCKGWHLPHHDNVSGVKPAPVEWETMGRIGEGKERELDAARRAAVWPDATDEELTAPGLEERLEARLPALMIEFRQALEELEFTWE